jgi:starch synthase
MKVLLAASEVAGFAKTGGLADVAAALPLALARRGHECAVLLPLYRGTRSAAPLTPTPHTFKVPVGNQPVAGRLWRSRLPTSSAEDPVVPVYLVEQPGYFERDDPAAGRGLYTMTGAGGRPADYPDNCERFAFFCRAVLEAPRLLDFWPDVLHLNDWQTGLVPVYLSEVYRRRTAWRVTGTPDFLLSRGYRRARTLLTVHNLAYQGVFPAGEMPATGLDWSLFNYRQLEFYGYLNFLKAGLVFADRITTVSPTYAREIQTPYFGQGLHGMLAERGGRVSGIVNGIDYEVWNPATDRQLPARYTIDSFIGGKALCKAALQRELGLPEDTERPLFAMIARLVEQKGVELLLQAATGFLTDGQLVVLGQGDPVHERRLGELQRQFPGRVAVRVGFDDGLAHRIEAGADLFLMPSLFEPSGLNQLYSMRYGTVPVVRATGGLADTVTDCTPERLAAGTATGFTFVAQTGDALLDAVRRALAVFREEDAWPRLVRTAMRQDWSWDRSAAAYEALYEGLVSERMKEEG